MCVCVCVSQYCLITFNMYIRMYSCSEISSLSAIWFFVPSSITVRLRGSYAEDRGPIRGRGLAFLSFFLISCI